MSSTSVPVSHTDAVTKPAVPPLLRDSTLYFLGNVASRALGLLMIPFYASHLSTDQYGVLTLVELATSIVAIVFGLQSIGQTLTRIYHDQSTQAARNQVVSTALIAACTGAVAVACIAVVFAPSIARAINLPDDIGLLQASFVAMVFSTMAEVVLVYQRMRERARFFLIYSMVSLFATLAFNIWFIGYRNLGVWGFVSSKLIVTGLGSLLLLVLAFREVGMAWAGRHARALAWFGGPLVLSSASYFAVHFSDRIFLAHVSRSDVGVYSMAYNFAFLLSILVGDSFGKSWNVTFYSYAESEGWQKRFVRIGAWLVFVLAAAAVAICLSGRDVLRVIVASPYIPPILLLPVLVFGYVFREIGDFFRNILLIDVGSGLVGRIAFATALLNLALNAVMIGAPLHFGIWGAAGATGITWIVYCATCWIAAQRLHRVPFRAAPLIRALAIAFVIIAAHVTLRAHNPYVQLLADAGWFILFLSGSAFLYLDREQRQEALDLARQTFRRVSARFA